MVRLYTDSQGEIGERLEQLQRDARAEIQAHEQRGDDALGESNSLAGSRPFPACNVHLAKVRDFLVYDTNQHCVCVSVCLSGREG